MSLNEKVIQNFPWKIVRKDLTKLIKEGQNVPIYVLEYLLGMYASTADEEQIKLWVDRVKKILADNYVRPDEAEKIKSKIKENNSYSIIDKITVKVDERKDAYTATFSNLWLTNVKISEKYVQQYEKLLLWWIWCMVQMTYFFDEEEKRQFSPFMIENLKPIQIPNVDLSEIIDARKNFTKDEWIDLLLRSTGMEPTQLEKNVKWHLLERMVPFIENNYNSCELWPRSTGKSHIYKEVSPNSILISWWQTTVANLFYNMASHQVWLVGLWDVVAFDEVAWINFKDKDWVQIMKDYMNSGSFARWRDQISWTASMVFVWNINESVDVLLKTSHLFSPFPDAMNSDTAFFDRMHYYIPWWEIPKFSSKHFTEQYGFIVDYLAEFFREMRKQTFASKISEYYSLWSSLAQRDSTAVLKTFSWLAKLIYPDGNMTKEDVTEILEYALQGRRRVKEQLKKIWWMEFYNTQFSFIDKETWEEHYISLPEMWWWKLIPEWKLNPWQLYFVSDANWMKATFKIETQMTNWTGQYKHSWLWSNAEARESTKVAFDYFKANAQSISNSIHIKDKDYHVAIQDLQWVWMAGDTTLPVFVAMCCIAMWKSVLEQLAILWSLSIGWTIKKVNNLADTLQVCADSWATKVLIPTISAADLWTVPSDLMSKFQIIFYSDAQDAVYKAVGLN